MLRNHMHKSLLSAATLLAATTSLFAQTLVTPPGFANAEGNTSSSYPWARGNFFIRIQYVYDSSSFTSQGITGAIPLEGFRWRANGSSFTYVGGTYSNVVIDLSSSVNDYLAMSTTFDANHGLDRANVLTGTVTVANSAGTIPNNWYVDVTFAQPFVYDPTLGNDLLVDITIPAGSYTSSGTGNPSSLDLVSGTAALGTRLWSLSNPTTSGAPQTNLAAVIDWKIPGFAQVSHWGVGCVDHRTSIYEDFPVGPTDLGNPTGVNSLLFTPNGSGGYVVSQGSNAWFAPVSADLALGDDQVSPAQTLPFSFPFPGGSTSAVGLCSNGYLWLDGTSTTADWSPTVAELLGQAARIAPHWCDLNPTAGGTIHFDVDPVSGDAICTWLGVLQFGSTTNTNTFQIALNASGSFELRYMDCLATNHILAGFSEGNGANDPGASNLSDAWISPLSTGSRTVPLSLTAGARPIIGGPPVALTTDNLAGSSLGVLLLSFTQHNPGIDLSIIGMPGCFQYMGTEAPNIFVPAGNSHVFSLGMPTTTSLSGLPFGCQSAAFNAGANAMGIVTSNAVSMVLGTL
ncbi:MAG: hypothetical protein Fur0037_19470 [Planctomycetota bacterium]